MRVAYNSGAHRVPLAAHQTMKLALARNWHSPRGKWTWSLAFYNHCMLEMRLWIALATRETGRIPRDSRSYFAHPHVNASAGWSSTCYVKSAKHSGLFQRRARTPFFGVCSQDLGHDGKNGQLKARCHIICASVLFFYPLTSLEFEG